MDFTGDTFFGGKLLCCEALGDGGLDGDVFVSGPCCGWGHCFVVAAVCCAGGGARGRQAGADGAGRA